MIDRLEYMQCTQILYLLQPQPWALRAHYPTLAWTRRFPSLAAAQKQKKRHVISNNHG